MSKIDLKTRLISIIDANTDEHELKYGKTN